MYVVPRPYVMYFTLLWKHTARLCWKQAVKFIRQNNIMTILIQDVNNTVAGYQKEILEVPLNTDQPYNQRRVYATSYWIGHQIDQVKLWSCCFEVSLLKRVARWRSG